MDEISKEGVKKAMGGQVLELEVDIALELGEKRQAEKVFCNMMKRNYNVDEAIEISEISRERATEILNSMPV